MGSDSIKWEVVAYSVRVFALIESDPIYPRIPVTLIQRFGSAANLNIHLHCLMLDGIYRLPDGVPTFQAIPSPTTDQLQA